MLTIERFSRRALIRATATGIATSSAGKSAPALSCKPPSKSAYCFSFFLVFFLMLLQTGCAALSPGQRTYTVSQTQLLELIAKKFPFNSRVAELLDVEVVAPRIKLLPESNRIATELDVAVSERLMRNSFQGALAMDYGLRFEPSDNSIRITGVKVSRLQFVGVPERFQSVVNSLAPFLAERLLNDLSLHQISAKDLAVVQGWGYAPDGFKITPEGLSISLVPRKAP